MNQPSTVSAAVATLDVPGATLHYEVRGEGPLVALVGSPMHAEHFAPLADRLAASHTVLTIDPRGINRSSVDYPDQDSTPEQRADDLARILVHLDAGSAAVLGSSGGAVVALALAGTYPELVHTVIAHEPPLNELLEDREERNAAVENVIATYLTGDVPGAWAKFLSNANITMPEQSESDEPAEAAAPPDPQQAADERFWFEHEMRPTTLFRPDLEALRTGTPRIVVGIGAESTDQICDRTSRSLAAALGTEPTIFPGGHIAFAEEPDAFLAALLAVLDES